MKDCVKGEGDRRDGLRSKQRIKGSQTMTLISFKGEFTFLAFSYLVL